MPEISTKSKFFEHNFAVNLYFGFFMIVKQSLECGDPAPLWLCCKTSVSRHLLNICDIIP